MSLTLAIPVWNDLPHLRRLLRRAAAAGCVDRVIVVDDGSDPAVTLAGLVPRALRGRVRLIRTGARRGAGACRNLALAEVETDHLLFFDADDLPTDALAPLVGDLAGRDFDFCLFKHADSRADARGVWGQLPDDESLWRVAGLAHSPLAEADPAQAALLAETANYPWNKIYRTGFLRENRIRCSDLMVHNDIELHWTSFLAARRILVSDRIAALHFVGRGPRLTDRRGAERLEVFRPLGQLAARLAAEAPERLLLPFLRFASGLFDWIRGRLSPALQSAFDTRVRGFLVAQVPPATFARLQRFDPVLALRLVLQMERGRA